MRRWGAHGRGAGLRVLVTGAAGDHGAWRGGGRGGVTEMENPQTKRLLILV